jgi:transcription initiation factor TFIIH subunit 1
VRLKLALVSDETGHNFTFTAVQPTALADREKFKAELTNIISRNRSNVAASATATSVTPSSALPPAGGPARPLAPLVRPSMSRTASATSEARGTPVNDLTSDFQLRKRVLLNTPELASLHKELVVGGHISESEFWEGREVCVPISCYVYSFISFLLASASGTSSSRASTEGEAWANSQPQTPNCRR